MHFVITVWLHKCCHALQIIYINIYEVFTKSSNLDTFTLSAFTLHMYVCIYHMWLDLQKLIVSPKTESSFFLPKTHKDTSIHYQVLLPKWSSLGWSASAGCAFSVHWQSVWMVWVLNGALGGGLVAGKRSMKKCQTKVNMWNRPWYGPHRAHNQLKWWLRDSTTELYGHTQSFTFPPLPPIVELTWCYHLGAHLSEKPI